MKALWKHDWYLSGKKLTAVLCLLAAFVVLYYLVLTFLSKNHPGHGSTNTLFVDFYSGNILPMWALPLLAGAMPGKMMEDDRRCGWERLCQAMPLTARQYVTEKYLFGLAFMGGSIVVVMLCQTVYVVWLGAFDGWYLTLFFLRYAMVFLWLSGMVTVLTLWKNLPLALLAVTGAAVLLPIILSLVGDAYWFGQEMLVRIGHFLEWLFDDPTGIVCGSISSVLLYGLSYVLARKIAERKGFIAGKKKGGGTHEGTLEV